MEGYAWPFVVRAAAPLSSFPVSGFLSPVSCFLPLESTS